jgi:ketosteroid isomerase-like protein
MSAAADFIAAINAHDADAIGALLTEDHLFVDAEGNEHRGRDAMHAAWRGYFEWFPDYAIDVERTVSVEGVTGFFGWASGTYSGNGRSWRLPAAWLAVERAGLVAEWRVYCDTRLPSEILGS